jgi:hypothetical protein
MDIYTSKIQMEFYKDGKLRGATVTFSDRSIIQLLPFKDDENFKASVLEKLKAPILAADMLRIKMKQETV